MRTGLAKRATKGKKGVRGGRGGLGGGICDPGEYALGSSFLSPGSPLSSTMSDWQGVSIRWDPKTCSRHCKGLGTGKSLPLKRSILTAPTQLHNPKPGGGENGTGHSCFQCEADCTSSQKANSAVESFRALRVSQHPHVGVSPEARLPVSLLWRSPHNILKSHGDCSQTLK